jgi:hypothetical protein
LGLRLGCSCYPSKESDFARYLHTPNITPRKKITIVDPLRLSQKVQASNFPLLVNSKKSDLQLGLDKNKSITNQKKYISTTSNSQSKRD